MDSKYFQIAIENKKETPLPKIMRFLEYQKTGNKYLLIWTSCRKDMYEKCWVVFTGTKMSLNIKISEVQSTKFSLSSI